MSHEKAPPTRSLLVVEDDPDHALLVGIAAQRARPGLDVRVVAKGEEAVAYLGGAPPYDDRDAHPLPDLVLLDLLLPGLGGFEVLAWAAQRSELDDVPLVVLSSSVSPHDRDRALELGARSFHSKPPDVAELGETVARILQRWLP